jgi:hypothetical protein
LQVFREYKFVISFENQLQPGYITEKIAHPLLAHAIPIYLGAPDIADHFNAARFIDVQRECVRSGDAGYAGD